MPVTLLLSTVPPSQYIEAVSVLPDPVTYIVHFSVTSNTVLGRHVASPPQWDTVILLCHLWTLTVVFSAET